MYVTECLNCDQMPYHCTCGKVAPTPPPTVATTTRAELIAELLALPIADDAPVVINIGRQNYAITCVISGDGNAYLEADAQIGRPKKFASDAERYAFHNANRKKKSRS